MSVKRNLITRQGYEKLCRELDALLHIKRPQLLEAVKSTSDDNIQESSAYQYATAELIQLDKRIGEIRMHLDSVEIFYPELQQDKSVVHLGAWVTFRYTDFYQTSSYKLVCEDEADPSVGKISWRSPFGEALLNAQIGDWVTIDCKGGKYDIIILDIQYD
jgi:transcription elongation factor GreB